MSGEELAPSKPESVFEWPTEGPFALLDLRLVLFSWTPAIRVGWFLKWLIALSATAFSRGNGADPYICRHKLLI